eukprot:scaffold56522_cov59-Attheya_sp.AAC.6
MTTHFTANDYFQNVPTRSPDKIADGQYHGHMAIFLWVRGDFSVLVNVHREPGYHQIHDLDTHEDYLSSISLHLHVLTAAPQLMD